MLARMDVTADDEVFVLDGDRLVGRILRSDIEHLRREGNWPGCIAAVDAMDRRILPRCAPGAAPKEAWAPPAVAGERQLPVLDTEGGITAVVPALDLEPAR